MLFTVCISVLPKNEIPDPTSIATLRSIRARDIDARSVRSGKWFEISLEAKSRWQARRTAHRAAKKLLAQQLIEQFTIVSVRKG